MRVDPTSHPQYRNILAVSAAVLAAERDTDQSIKTLSALIATTLTEFADAGLPAAAAQRALDNLAVAMNTQIEGRRMLTEAHRDYGRVAQSLGASADEWGPTWPCHEIRSASKPKPAPLRRVA